MQDFFLHQPNLSLYLHFLQKGNPEIQTASIISPSFYLLVFLHPAQFAFFRMTGNSPLRKLEPNIHNLGNSQIAYIFPFLLISP